MKIKIWKTLQVGTFPSVKALTRAFVGSGTKLSPRARQIVTGEQYQLLVKPTKLKLVKVAVRELGFQKLARYETVFSKAKKQGLGLCPLETGPMLALNYLEQPLSDKVIIATESLALPTNDSKYLLSVRNGYGGKWCDVHYGCYWLSDFEGEAYCFSPDDVLIFCLSEKLRKKRTKQKDKKEG